MDTMFIDLLDMMRFILPLFFMGLILDVLLIPAVVALYYSFIKRWRLYSKVTRQLRKAMKKHI